MTRAVLLIDGRSGAGKTTLARSIVERWPDAQLVSLDDIYPGWDGLARGSAAIHRDILPANRWRRWDWRTGRPAEWHDLDPARPLVIEGCGALSAANRRRATAAVWVAAEDGERRRRALDRDGDAFGPHWERWAAQEDAFIARERPRELADLEVADAAAAAASVDWASFSVQPSAWSRMDR